MERTCPDAPPISAPIARADAWRAPAGPVRAIGLSAGVAEELLARLGVAAPAIDSAPSAIPRRAELALLAWPSFAPGREPRAELERLHATGLAERSWLLVALPPVAAPAEVDRARLELAEAGFVLWRADCGPLGGPPVWLARRDRHRFRPGRAADEAAILALFPRAFGAPRDPDHWRWRYLDSPLGGPWITVGEDDTGALVAHYAAYPVAFERVAGGTAETFLAAQVGDLMTAPEARRSGLGPRALFARAADHFHASRRRDGVAFSYGFHTAASRAFSLRFSGARLVTPVIDRRLEPAALPSSWRRPQRALALAGWRARQLTAVDPRFDRLYRRVRAAYGLLVRRDRAWLAWRYCRCPDRDYRLLALERGDELAGWAVFRRDGNRLVWGDALVDPAAGAGMALLLAAALENEAGTGTARIDGWFSREPRWWDALLSELGFVPAADPDDLALTTVAGLFADPVSLLGRELYMTRGDGDLF